MLASHTRILDAVVSKINNSIATQSDAALGVQITQVNLTMPDGKPVVLTWNPEARKDADGNPVGDWVVTLS